MNDIRRIRIRTHEESGQPLISDPEGNSLNVLITGATIRVSANYPLPISTLEIIDPNLNVVSQMVDLERLEAAEKVCQRASILIENLLARWVDAPFGSGPVPIPCAVMHLAVTVRDEIDQWGAVAGVETYGQECERLRKAQEIVEANGRGDGPFDINATLDVLEGPAAR